MLRETPITISPNDDQNEDCRRFLATCGRLAVVTPPAITALMSTSLTSDAIMDELAGFNGHRSPPPEVLESVCESSV
jgi:hypothetical protein